MIIIWVFFTTNNNFNEKINDKSEVTCCLIDDFMSSLSNVKCTEINMHVSIYRENSVKNT